jgi:hypothetical protein
MCGIGYTPFFMVHGSEAVLPTDFDYGSPRVRAYTNEGNQVSLKDVIDQLDEAQGALLEINPLPTPIYGCNMAVLVASGISCIEVRWLINGCNWNGVIA